MRGCWMRPDLRRWCLRRSLRRKRPCGGIGDNLRESFQVAGIIRCPAAAVWDIDRRDGWLLLPCKRGQVANLIELLRNEEDAHGIGVGLLVVVDLEDERGTGRRGIERLIRDKPIDAEQTAQPC